MSRIVDLGPRRVELVTPVEAAAYDPSMQDWLALPKAVDDCACPHCGSEYFGTQNPIGYFLVRRCSTCGGEYRGEASPHMIAKIVGALTGEDVRLAR